MGGSMGGSRGGQGGGGGPMASFSPSMVGAGGMAGGMAGGERDLTGAAEARYQREQARLRKDLAAEKRTSARLRALVVERQNGKAELEEFFLRSIEAVKKSIVRRRRAQASPVKGGGGGGVESGPLSSSMRAQSPSLGVGAGMGGPEDDGMGGDGQLLLLEGDDGSPAGDAAVRQALGGLSGFTATDRARVIESLLGQDEVLAFLYDHLFPPPAEAGSSAGAQQGSAGGALAPPPMGAAASPSAGGVAAGSGARAVQAMAGGNGGPLGLDADTQQYLMGTGGARAV
jgi:hypothetical protein